MFIIYITLIHKLFFKLSPPYTKINFQTVEVSIRRLNRKINKKKKRKTSG